jgi:hypothetical protein
VNLKRQWHEHSTQLKTLEIKIKIRDKHGIRKAMKGITREKSGEFYIKLPKAEACTWVGSITGQLALTTRKGKIIHIHVHSLI